MKTADQNHGFFVKIKGKLQKQYSINRGIVQDTVITNLKRLRYFTITAMPVSLAIIISFAASLSNSNQNEYLWRTEIISCHISLFIIMGALGCLSLHFQKRETATVWMYFTQYAAVAIILVFGAIITSIDQLVTSNITPFLIACTISGAVFLLRPAVAVIAYSGVFLVFFYTIELHQTNQNILLSNRVNGISAIAIGVCLTLILWKAFASNIMQKRYIAEQQSELANKNQELINLAFYDPMTLLYNRRRFEELLQFEFAAVSRSGRESCIIILDIDHFKEINDNYGHPFGDMVLKQTAQILKENTRKMDAVSRWGGEEFFILLPNSSLSDGKCTAEKLRRLIEEKTYQMEDREIRVTASFGVTVLKGSADHSMDRFYQEADHALYTAKENGRNRVETI